MDQLTSLGLKYLSEGMPWWQALVMAAHVFGVTYDVVRDQFECGLA